MQAGSLKYEHDKKGIFVHTKEHCLMGIKGTVRRNQDGHIIHANVDTDVIVSEELPPGSTSCCSRRGRMKQRHSPLRPQITRSPWNCTIS
jgi:hypothetical protein